MKKLIIILMFCSSLFGQTSIVVAPGSGGGGTGTVTSVGISGPAEMSVTGSPITTSGSITLNWQTQTASLVFAAPLAGGTPTFRLLTAADIPSLAPIESPTFTGTSTIPVMTGTSNLMEVRNGTNAQSFRVYNTWTSSTNCEFGSLEWSSNILRIGVNRCASGTVRTLQVAGQNITFLTSANGSTNPSATFGMDNTAIYQAGDNTLDLGKTAQRFNDLFLGAQIRLGDGTSVIEQAAAGVTSVKNSTSTSDATHRVIGANGSFRESATATELITLSTGGTTTNSSTNLLPANSMIRGVGCRITTTITGATNWSVGDPTTAARFCASNSTLTAGTTSVCQVHVDQTGAAGPRQTSAATLRITTTGTPSAGAIRCTVFADTLSAPSS